MSRLPNQLIGTQVVMKLLGGSQLSEEEQKEAIAKYMEEAEGAKQKFKDMQSHSQAVLAAKLAARRRMKVERSKEDAMKKELLALSKKQVTRSPVIDLFLEDH